MEKSKPREKNLVSSNSNLASNLSKRKKDGVFYTPAYITKYIVENTIGTLCEKKKTELAIDETEYVYKCRKDKKEKLSQKLTAYRTWLLSLKICDPACGSGAFLNAALQFLKAEHSLIDELNAKMHGDTLVFQEIENSILENNLFGVDINEESVEIAKLSLWLHTAQKGRKLTTLNNNIKCGNSLIADPAIAGDKAFDWKAEFPQVFASHGDVENGGFDVVIGNPPYVQLQSMGEMSNKYEQCGYEVFHKGADLYCLFTERGFKLLKKGGLQSFIMPNKWMLVDYGKPLRSFMAKTGLRQILNFGDIQFFKDAATIVCIFVTANDSRENTVKVLSLNQKTYHGDFITEIPANLFEAESSSFTEKEWSIQPKGHTQLLEKMKNNGVELCTLPINIYRGILTGFNDAFYIDEKTKDELIKKDSKSAEIIKPMVRGRDIAPYCFTDSEYLIGTFPAKNLNIEDFPAIKDHLLSFGKERLEQSGAKGARKKTNGKWFDIQDSISYWKEFEKEKIVYPEITAFQPFTYDKDFYYSNNKAFILTAKDNTVSLLALTAIFNSSLCKLWIWYNCPELLGGTREIRKVYFEHFPVPKTTDEQKSVLETLAKTRIDTTSRYQKQLTNFTRLLENNLHIEKLSTALQNFYTLDFATFLKEVSKQKTTDNTKAKIPLKDQPEWNDAFDTSKSACLDLQATIEATDNQINQQVYKLYGLTEEEVKVVEGR